mmetsp:Transcript_7317/g.13648  ORF Transcript_7317/g.13648 Transcript_7317/m.13648 type:complete len:447 (-) Transcript_7317:197-1537(-)
MTTQLLHSLHLRIGFIIKIITVITSCTLIGASASASPTGGNGNEDEGFAKLVSWMKLHGGRVDSRINVTATDNGIRGVYALSSIEPGTELLFCPWNLIIGSTSVQNQMQKGDGMCTVVQRMADEIRLGEQSLWHPYLNHIELPRLAANWDSSALAELQGLSPIQDATRHVQWFRQNCGGDLMMNNAANGDDHDDDGAAMRSLVAFISRASEVGMIPIYDLFNHHNGKRNAKLSIVEDGVRLVTVGKVEGDDDDNNNDGRRNHTIRRGEQLYISYGLKTSSNMYRDYAFVEDWPSCWNFADSTTGDNYAFVSFEKGIAAINPSADFLRYIVQSNESPEEYEESAGWYSESLSVVDLERFVGAVRSRLGEFATTLGEDRKLLFAEEQALLVASSMSSSSGDSTNRIEDVLSAMNYRIAFKSALTSSYIYAESMVATKTIENDAIKQEL